MSRIAFLVLVCATTAPQLAGCGRIKQGISSKPAFSDSRSGPDSENQKSGSQDSLGREVAEGSLESRNTEEKKSSPLNEGSGALAICRDELTLFDTSPCLKDIVRINPPVETGILHFYSGAIANSATEIKASPETSNRSSIRFDIAMMSYEKNAVAKSADLKIVGRKGQRQLRFLFLPQKGVAIWIFDPLEDGNYLVARDSNGKQADAGLLIQSSQMLANHPDYCEVGALAVTPIIRPGSNLAIKGKTIELEVRVNLGARESFHLPLLVNKNPEVAEIVDGKISLLNSGVVNVTAVACGSQFALTIPVASGISDSLFCSHLATNIQQYEELFPGCLKLRDLSFPNCESQRLDYRNAMNVYLLCKGDCSTQQTSVHETKKLVDSCEENIRNGQTLCRDWNNTKDSCNFFQSKNCSGDQAKSLCGGLKK